MHRSTPHCTGATHQAGRIAQPRRAWRVEATVGRIQLRVSEFSGILIREHFDVRRLLLADPASLALVASSLFPSLLTTHQSLFTSHKGFAMAVMTLSDKLDQLGTRYD